MPRPVEPFAALLGPPPPSASATDLPGNPWDRRRELGLRTAFVQCVKQIGEDPDGTFGRTRRRGDLAGAVLFGVAIGWVGLAANRLWRLLLGPGVGGEVPDEVGARLALWLQGSLEGFLLELALGPVAVLLALLAASTVLHALLGALGGTADSRAGFEGTLRAVAFGGVAHMAQIFPVVGGFISVLWGVPLVCLALMGLHGASRKQATAAVLIPLAVGYGLSMAGSLLAFGHLLELLDW